MADDGDAYFLETQRLPGWVMALVLVAAGSSIGVFLIGFYVQLVRNEPWGDNPLSDGALTALGIGFIVLGLGLIWLFASLKLITEVHADHIRIRFAPMRAKRIPFADIASADATTVSPIRDYGGWGVRYGKGTKAYLANGNRGVLLTMPRGKNLLIGSQVPNELATALRMWMSS